MAVDDVPACINATSMAASSAMATVGCVRRRSNGRGSAATDHRDRGVRPRGRQQGELQRAEHGHYHEVLKDRWYLAQPHGQPAPSKTQTRHHVDGATLRPVHVSTRPAYGSAGHGAGTPAQQPGDKTTDDGDAADQEQIVHKGIASRDCQYHGGDPDEDEGGARHHREAQRHVPVSIGDHGAEGDQTQQRQAPAEASREGSRCADP